MESMDIWNQYLRPLWLVWVMMIFALVVFWAYRPKNKKRFEDDAAIPLRED